MGWKLAIVAAISGFVIYRLRFAPIAVDARAAAGPITAEVMGTGTLESRYPVTISPKITGLITQVLALLGKGAALGVVLAFMMSVIGLSLPEAVILRKVLNMRLILTFFGIVAAGILMVGYLFNLLM